MKPANGSRRAFLHHVTRALGGSWLAASLPAMAAAAELAVSRQARGESWKILDVSMAVTLGAVADQIFPADETPGAVEIGAVRFMDAALEGFMASALPVLRNGCGDLDQRAMEAYSRVFGDLDSAEQIELLRLVENTPFFGIAHFLTLCGVFALPAYGGNRELAGWRLLEFEPRHKWVPPFGHYDAQYREGQDHAGA